MHGLHGLNWEIKAFAKLKKIKKRFLLPIGIYLKDA
jgi:hypothetical protein